MPEARALGHGAARPHSRRSWILITLGELAILVIGRLVASSLIKRVIASNLENMPGGYQGTVESVAIRTLE